MIKIDFYKNGLIVCGHANFSQYGSDIVCAGVSSIVYGGLNWFIEDKVKIILSDGYVKLTILKGYEQGLEYLQLLRKQLYSLNHGSYQAYLQFHEHENEIPSN